MVQAISEETKTPPETPIKTEADVTSYAFSSDLDQEELKQPIDNSLSGLIALNEKEVNYKHNTIEDFKTDEFHSHAILKVLKN